jgi:hypothetical protein
MRNGLGYAGIPKEIIAELGPVADRRPEELTPEEFVGLTKDIEARKSTFQAGKDSNRQ